jgi:hypothetical protein
VAASLLAAAVLLGLGWLIVQNRPVVAPKAIGSGNTPTRSSSTPPPAPPSPPAPVPAEPATTKATSEQAIPEGVWGSASAYKFGQLPGGDYPHSCAFSETDPSGRVTTANKGNLEYWACRDVGGAPESGYRVVRADGKETTYTFGPNGVGTVVGTNGSSYQMRWSNDSHRGQDIVVINHQDGAISWIPGHIGSPGE